MCKKISYSSPFLSVFRTLREITNLRIWPLSFWRILCAPRPCYRQSTRSSHWALLRVQLPFNLIMSVCLFGSCFWCLVCLVCLSSLSSKGGKLHFNAQIETLLIFFYIHNISLNNPLFWIPDALSKITQRMSRHR